MKPKKTLSMNLKPAALLVRAIGLQIAVSGIPLTRSILLAFSMSGLLLNSRSQAGDGTNTTTGTVTANWSALTWTGSPPNGIGDVATFNFTGDQQITLDTPITLERLNNTGTGQFNLLRNGTNALTFDNTTDSEPASVLFTRTGGNATGRRIDANVVLNSDLIATWGRVQGASRVHGFRGIVSGTGRLSLNYAIAPTEGPDTGTPIVLDGSGATAAHHIHLGLAGDAANTYTGGTDLRAGNSVFGTVKFMANKSNALGSPGTAGRLFMHQAALDMLTFDQTVGGLSGGTGSSKISSTSSTAGTTNLNIDFGSAKGPFSFSGVVMDGASTGISGAARIVALTKAGSGNQTLTGSNTYTGATTVNAGKLLVNGTHITTTGGAGYTVTNAGSTLGGTGRIAINGNVSVGSMGVLAPGASIGTLTLDGANTTGNVLTMATGSKFSFELDGGGGTPDQLAFWNYVAGDLVLNTNAIDLSLLGTQAAGTYNVDIFRFFSDGGATAATHDFTSGLTIGSLGTGISSASIDWDGTGNNSQTIALTYTVVPEPNFAALIGSFGTLLLLRRRR